MLKKLTTKQDQKIEAEARAQFATDIIELYRARLAEETVTPHPDPEVRAVAYGLVALKQAIAPHLLQHRNDPHALIYTGVVMADGIIDALTTGRNHPLWKHTPCKPRSIGRAPLACMSSSAARCSPGLSWPIRKPPGYRSERPLLRFARASRRRIFPLPPSSCGNGWSETRRPREPMQTEF